MQAKRKGLDVLSITEEPPAVRRGLCMTTLGGVSPMASIGSRASRGVTYFATMPNRGGTSREDAYECY